MDIDCRKRKREVALRKSRLRSLGAICLALGLGWLFYQNYMIYYWEKAIAVVVRVESFRTSDSGGGQSTTYQPTVRFKISSGREYTLTPGYRSSQFNFERGSAVAIAYNPDRPTQFRFTGFMTYWALPIAASLFGALVMYASRFL